MRGVLKLRGHGDAVLCLAAAPDSGLLASGSEDGCIALHDVAAAMAASGGSGQAPAPAPAATAAISPAFMWRPTDEDGGPVKTAVAAAPGSDTSSGDGLPPVTALAFHPKEPTVLYAAVGSRLLRLDTTRGPAAAVTAAVPANEAGEEVNSISIHHSGSYLAAADDGGGVCIFDISGSSIRPLRALRAAHAPIASSVAFRRHRPWELLSGGLDCRIVRWDFSKSRRLGGWAMGGELSGGHEAPGAAPRVCNPPMVHCLASPRGDGPAARRLAAAACGDGSVAVFSVEEGGGGGGGNKAKQQPQQQQKKATAKGKQKPQQQQQQPEEVEEQQQQQQQQPAGPVAYTGQDVSVSLGRERGGHTRPAAAVCFLETAGGGRYLASGGEDRRLVVWDWQAALAEPPAAAQGGDQNSDAAEEGPVSQQQQQEAVQGARAAAGAAAAPPLALSPAAVPEPTAAAGQQPVVAWAHTHGRKVNALTTLTFKAPGSSSSSSNVKEYLCVADTSRQVTLYPVVELAASQAAGMGGTTA